MRTFILALVAVIGMTGCVTLPRHERPPQRSQAAAPIGFSPSVRALGVDWRLDRPPADIVMGLRAAATDGSLDVLALSGGGASGAFGAGALVGLNRAHARPQFELVTGVSAGALIAPFAFLGPEWDTQLTDAFVGDRSESLVRRRGILGLFGTSFFEGEPLRQLVDGLVTDAMIHEVARESAKGRLLLVATTDLDKSETVVWNLGAIAATGGEAARTLFRDVIVASSSIPGIFPPVMITVSDVNGVAYQEMHVDGGVTVPFFIAPGSDPCRTGPAAGRARRKHLCGHQLRTECRAAHHADQHALHRGARVLVRAYSFFKNRAGAERDVRGEAGHVFPLYGDTERRRLHRTFRF